MELDVVLIHRHAALLQIVELLTHALGNTSWNMMSSKIPAEVGPADHSTPSRVFVLLPPISCLVLELEGSELDTVLRSDITALKMFVDVHEPIFVFH